MTNDLTLEKLEPYLMSEDALLDMIQDHLIGWAKEEAQANDRSFGICYEETRNTFLDALQVKV
jgi:hypothetical protein